jgi:hypothetical protein
MRLWRSSSAQGIRQDGRKNQTDRKESEGDQELPGLLDLLDADGFAFGTELPDAFLAEVVDQPGLASGELVVEKGRLAALHWRMEDVASFSIAPQKYLLYIVSPILVDGRIA